MRQSHPAGERASTGEDTVNLKKYHTHTVNNLRIILTNRIRFQRDPKQFTEKKTFKIKKIQQNCMYLSYLQVI